MRSIFHVPINDFQTHIPTAFFQGIHLMGGHHAQPVGIELQIPTDDHFRVPFEDVSGALNRQATTSVGCEDTVHVAHRPARDDDCAAGFGAVGRG